MTAAVLREAASLMRSRAEAAIHDSEGEAVWRHDPPDVFAGTWLIAERLAAPDAEHIASWHPAVALAVADWLDEEADDWTDPDDDGLAYYRAYLVATAYLGTP